MQRSGILTATNYQAKVQKNITWALLFDETDFVSHEIRVDRHGNITGGVHESVENQVINVPCVKEHLRFYETLLTSCLAEIESGTSRENCSALDDILKRQKNNLKPTLEKKLANTKEKIRKRNIRNTERGAGIEAQFNAKRQNVLLKAKESQLRTYI